MSKKMTLRERAKNWVLLNISFTEKDVFIRTACGDSYIAGHRAGARLTKAERKVIEAAVKWANANHRDKTLTVNADLADAVANLEAKKVRK